jgi:CRISPR-associated protein Cmx8
MSPGSRKAKKVSLPSTLTLDWNLADLPSSQHRAGLAGLVLVVRFLERKGPVKGICRLARVDARGATLELDEGGLAALFDEIYAASSEEIEVAQPYKNKDKDVVPPLRTEERLELDARGKERKKTVYIYPRVVPAGSFLADIDSPGGGGQGLWIKLWRDLVWTVLRGVPKTRGPFEARAAKRPTRDAADAWSELVAPGNPSRSR